MGSPCVLLNSLALFFVPGQEGVATNEVGGCRLSQQREGEHESPRGGGVQRKESGYIWGRRTRSHMLVFVSSFFNVVLLEGSCGHQRCIIGPEGKQKRCASYVKLKQATRGGCVCYTHTCVLHLSQMLMGILEKE